MEGKLSETREQLVRLETKVDLVLSQNSDEHTRIFAKLQSFSDRVEALEDANLTKEVSWRTLAKIGSVALAVITFGITLYEFLPKILGVC